MKIRATFWMAVSGEGGQAAATVSFDLSEEDCQKVIDSARQAMHDQAAFEMIASNSTMMINMRYVTNYTFERTTTVTSD